MVDRYNLLLIAVFGNAQYFNDYMLELDGRQPEEIEEEFADSGDSFFDDWYDELLAKNNIRRAKDATQMSDRALRDAICGRTRYVCGAFEEYARRKGYDVKSYNLVDLGELAVDLGFKVDFD